MNRKRATQDDVAAVAGVTRATVSYVLTGRAESLKITPEVIKRVKEAALELKYLPNLAARSLAIGKSFQIGIVFRSPDFLRNHYWGQILSGIQKAVLGSQYEILMVQGDDVVSKAGNYLLQNRIDAVIYLGNLKEHEVRELPSPPVLVGGIHDEGIAPMAYTVTGEAFKAVVERIVACGIKNVVWMAPPADYLKRNGSYDRLENLTNACQAAKLNLHCQPLSPPPAQRPVQAEIEHWHSDIAASKVQFQKGAAYVCWNDLLALGLYTHLQSAGLRPGREVAVVGMDNSFAEAALPPLASISFDHFGVGKAVVELAMEYSELSHRNAPLPKPYKSIAVEAVLVDRPSLGLSND